jgi:hypothetical protein
VRGTVRLQDALTDLVCEHARFETATHGPCTQGEGTRVDEGEGATIGATMEGQPMVGEAHAGMLKAAERLLAALRPTIEKTLLELPAVHELCLCGHSLGGGLAALMAVLIGPMLRKRYGWRLAGWRGPAPCLGGRGLMAHGRSRAGTRVAGSRYRSKKPTR